jgi:protein TonB
MYADRRHTKFDPGSMGLALALNGTIVIGLIAFAAPHFVPKVDHPLIVEAIKLRPPPPPVDIPPPPETHETTLPPPSTVDIVTPLVPTTAPDSPVFPPEPPAPPTPIGSIAGGGGEPIKLPPVVIGPVRDPRYAANFQPDYPASERRAGHQGRVVVRVLIGVDGRVKQVEKVSAVSDAFFEVTERRALDKWRFKPGTRDGVPVETWYTTGVSFVLNDE